MGTKYFINRSTTNLHDLANYSTYAIKRMNARGEKKIELLFGSHKRSDHFKNQSIELQIFGYPLWIKNSHLSISSSRIHTTSKTIS